MNRHSLLVLDRSELVDGLADYIHHASQSAAAHGNGDRSANVIGMPRRALLPLILGDHDSGEAPAQADPGVRRQNASLPLTAAATLARRS